MAVELEKSFLRVMKTKRKMVRYATHSAETDITVLVPYAGNSALRTGETMEHSAKSHIPTEEVPDTLRNLNVKANVAKTVKNGEHFGTRNVERISTMQHVVYAVLIAQKR